MSAGAWDDIGNRPLPPTDPYFEKRNAETHHETYEEALARSLVGQKDAPLTERELAEKLAKDKELLRKHDSFYADQFLEAETGIPVSKYLARQLGSAYDPKDDEGDMGGMK